MPDICQKKKNATVILITIFYITLHVELDGENVHINPRPTKPFFCNMVYQGGWLPPPYELEIDSPKV